MALLGVIQNVCVHSNSTILDVKRCCFAVDITPALLIVNGYWGFKYILVFAVQAMERICFCQGKSGESEAQHL